MDVRKPISVELVKGNKADYFVQAIYANSIFGADLRWTQFDYSTNNGENWTFCEEVLHSGSKNIPIPTSQAYPGWGEQRDRSIRFRARGKTFEMTGLNSYEYAYSEYCYVSSGVVPIPQYGYSRPSEPTIIKTERISLNEVRVSLANNALYADSIQFMVSSDGVTWEAPDIKTGHKITQFEFSTNDNKQFFLVVRNRILFHDTINGDTELVSDWSAAASVAPVSVPLAPSIIAPGDNEYVDRYSASFRWIAVHPDGSPVERVELSVTRGNTTRTMDVTRGQSSDANGAVTIDLSVATHPYDPKQTAVICKLRTKSRAAGWSPFSSERKLHPINVPRVSIQSDTEYYDDYDGPVILVDRLPIVISWSYEDPVSAQKRASVSFFDRDNKHVYTKTVNGTATELKITSDDWIPEDKKGYVVKVEVESMVGLKGEPSEQLMVTNFNICAPAPYIDTMIDEDRGTVHVKVTPGNQTNETLPTGYLELYRKHLDDDTLVQLVSKQADEIDFIDPYCPIGASVFYVACALTDTGVPIKTSKSICIPYEKAAFINFGSDVCLIALNSDYSFNTVPEVEYFNTAGSNWPLSFYGSGQQMEGTLSGTSLRTKKVNMPDHKPLDHLGFYALARYRGDVVIRLPYLDGFMAGIEMSFTSDTVVSNQINVKFRRVKNNGLAL